MYAAQALYKCPHDLPEPVKVKLRNVFTVHLEACIDDVYKSAMLVASTPYGTLGTLAKFLHSKPMSFLAVDEAAPIDEGHVMQCVYFQSVFQFAFNPSSCQPSARPRRQALSLESTHTRTRESFPWMSACSIWRGPSSPWTNNLVCCLAYLTLSARSSTDIATFRTSSHKAQT